MKIVNLSIVLFTMSFLACNKSSDFVGRIDLGGCQSEKHANLANKIKFKRTPSYDTIKYGLVNQKEQIVEIVNNSHRVIYTYENDLLIKTESFHKGISKDLEHIAEYYYNELGQIVRYNYPVFKDELKETQQFNRERYNYKLFSYDSNGFPVKIEEYAVRPENDVDQYNGHTEMEWENCNLVQSTAYFEDGSGKIEFVFEYDDRINPYNLQQLGGFHTRNFSRNNIIQTEITIYEGINLGPEVKIKTEIHEFSYEYNELDLPIKIHYNHTGENRTFEYDLK